MFCGTINMLKSLKQSEEPWSLQSRTDNHKSDARDVTVTASNGELIGLLKQREG